MNVSAHSMRTLAQALRAKGLVARMELIEKARVPIIKLVDSIGGFSIDISFDTAGGVSAAHFVREAVEAFPALRPLTIVLKQFLHHRRLNEVFTGGLGSFALTLMVLSFLKVCFASLIALLILQRPASSTRPERPHQPRAQPRGPAPRVLASLWEKVFIAGCRDRRAVAPRLLCSDGAIPLAFFVVV